MWYKVKTSKQYVTPSGKEKTKTEYWLCDRDNFAEAGYDVMKYLDGNCEVEDISLMKNYKPLANQRYNDNNKVFIVKFAEDFVNEDGTVKTQKYPVPFFASSNSDLQKIIEEYIKQGLDNMRVTTVSETQWNII